METDRNRNHQSNGNNDDNNNNNNNNSSINNNGNNSNNYGSNNNSNSNDSNSSNNINANTQLSIIDKNMSESSRDKEDRGGIVVFDTSILVQVSNNLAQVSSITSPTVFSLALNRRWDKISFF